MSVTTLLNTDRPLGDFALERDIIWQPCPLRWSLPRGRNALVHHTSEVVRALCFDHLVLALPSAYKKACSRKHAIMSLFVKSTRPSRAVDLATRGCASFWRARRLRIHS